MKKKTVMKGYKLIVGATTEDAGKAFLRAWKKAARGKPVRERVLAFESWEGLAAVMTPERYRLMRCLRRNPAPSVSALARKLKRHYRRVHADVAALESAGLLARSDGAVRTTADVIRTTIRF